MPKFRYAKPAPIKWYGYFPAAILRRKYSGGFTFYCRYGPCGLVCTHGHRIDKYLDTLLAMKSEATAIFALVSGKRTAAHEPDPTLPPHTAPSVKIIRLLPLHSSMIFWATAAQSCTNCSHTLNVNTVPLLPHNRTETTMKTCLMWKCKPLLFAAKLRHRKLTCFTAKSRFDSRNSLCFA